jgi:2-amino-4-hydroxy-6-hydroxymethyldihydropteridine diphosphokinase
MKIETEKLGVIALGANLPGAMRSCVATLEAALDGFSSERLQIVKRSRWWRSRAWPNPDDPPYLNGVAVIRTELAPIETLTALHRIEVRFDRQRTIPNAPRTLDLDLICLGEIVRSDEALTLPHPRAADRLFVMGPLAEIWPDWVHPSHGRTATELANGATIGLDAAPMD